MTTRVDPERVGSEEDGCHRARGGVVPADSPARVCKDLRGAREPRDRELAREPIGEPLHSLHVPFLHALSCEVLGDVEEGRITRSATRPGDERGVVERPHERGSEDESQSSARRAAERAVLQCRDQTAGDRAALGDRPADGTGDDHALRERHVADGSAEARPAVGVAVRPVGHDAPPLGLVEQGDTFLDPRDRHARSAERPR